MAVPIVFCSSAYRKALQIAKAVSISSNLQGRLVYNIAYCLNLDATLSRSVEKKRGALRCMKECLRMMPRSYTAWNLLGIIAASDGKLYLCIPKLSM